MIRNKKTLNNALFVGLVATTFFGASPKAEDLASVSILDAVINVSNELDIKQTSKVCTSKELADYLGKEASKTELELAIKAILIADGKPYKDKSGTADNPVMQLFNGILSAHPVGTVRIEMAYEATTRVFMDLPNVKDNPSDVAKKMTYLLAPVKRFFTEIRAYSGTILPLVKESFGKMHETGIDEKNSILISFLTGKTEDAALFFGEQVTTLPKLAQIAYEFIVFFKDLKASFSSEVKMAARDFMDKIEKNKQAVAANTRG